MDSVLHHVHLFGRKSHHTAAPPHLFDTWLFVALESIDTGLKNLTVSDFGFPAFAERYNVIVLMTERPVTTS